MTLYKWYQGTEAECKSLRIIKLLENINAVFFNFNRELCCAA